ncbi:MAG: hypothetical protein ABFD98_14345 [Syntrophobacteraceae bacterium]
MDSATDRVICNMKSIRRAKGLSQSRLGELVGVKKRPHSVALTPRRGHAPLRPPDDDVA